MELWIRSQDGKKLINTNKLFVRDYHKTVTTRELFKRPSQDGFKDVWENVDKEEYIETTIEDNDGFELAKYKSKQRGIEVLNGIEKFIVDTVNGAINQSNIVLNCIVYDMPKE